MSTQETIKMIKELTIGNSLNVESESKHSAIELTKDVPGSFTVVKVTENIYSIIRVEEKETVANIIESYSKKVKWFNKIAVPASLAHSRVIVGRINKRDNDCIKAISSGKDVVLLRNIRDVDISSLSFDEKIAIKLEFDEFMNPQDEKVQDEEII